MSIRRLSQRSILSVSNRVNSANVKTILSVPPRLYAEYLVVGGGGAGGTYGGGGGGGGYLTSNLNIIAGKTYVITVGAGGGYSVDPKAGFNGSNSSIISDISPSANVIAYGGGGGGGSAEAPTGRNNGGSGGGGSQGQPGGIGIYPGSAFVSAPRQGYDGGFAPGGGNYLGGGGGGAGQAGFEGYSGSDLPPGNRGNGGNGLVWLNGVYYAGGGGGNGYPTSHRKGQGGLGGGATAPSDSISRGANATINTGGGGAAGGYGDPTFIVGGFGGSGVVIIRSLVVGATTGSNVLVTSTILNGDEAVQYTFYSSGTITF